MSVKKQQAELKTLVQQTFNEIKGSLKPRTAFDYQYEITNNYKKNVLTKSENKMLKKFKNAVSQIKQRDTQMKPLPSGLS